MYPYLFEIFGFKVYSYGIVMVGAFILCFVLALKYTPKNLLSQQDLLNFCLILMASLLIGTKLTGMIIQGDFSPAAWLNLLKFWQRGSFSFFPAVLLAIALIYFYCRRKSIPFFKTMDYLLPYAILAIAIQRTFGCFLAGCCYGKPTHLPWGVIFPKASRAGSHFPGIPLHPTQLYYGTAAWLIVIFLAWYKKKSRYEGEITAIGLMMLAATYFFITFFRGDIAADQVFLHLSHSQYFALALLIASLFIFLMQSIKGKKFQNL
jgi:phosphatidylglycerol:prolipoprotein diacylglycerol transferase